MPDLHYTEPRLAALYDMDSGWSEDRAYYLALAGQQSIRILDLGCGTGLLAAAYAARGHRVTGVDPARAMLDLARNRPGGGAVDWVEASAGAYRSDRQFDLIVMTGNAFQVFLTEAEVQQVLITMRLHLAPDGRVVFETRNPALDWAARWDWSAELVTGGQTVRMVRRVLARSGKVVRFETRYTAEDWQLTSESRLLFLSAAEIAALAGRAGLRVAALLGDWQGQMLDPERSEEMVFVLQAATAEG